MPLVNNLDMENSLKTKLHYMYSLRRFGIKPGLEVISAILEQLGHPEADYPSIHITGTNGKGSTAAMLASILQSAGLKVGLYTSPHLFSFNERIKVDGHTISDESLGRYIDRIQEITKNAPPTFFEFTTAIAFKYFSDQHIDIAVIEVGLGGTYDATNVIRPEIAIITNVSLDHTDILGKTRKEIARDKAGIIKPGCDVITAEENPEVLSIFRQACKKQSATLHEVKNNITVHEISGNWQSQVFRTEGAVEGEFELRLLGKHQLANAATALLAVKLLKKRSSAMKQWNNLTINNDSIHDGLEKTAWPGRLQGVSEKPFVLIDGAHNEASALALRRFIEEKELEIDVLVLGIKEGKDADRIIDILTPLARHVITTEGAYQPMDAGKLSDMIPGSRPIKEVPKAIQEAKAIAGEKGKIIITGSLYMIPEAMKALNPKSQTPMPNQ